jgi:exopolysaccharide biosynthesis polyprenyl glycosylphosphotransferase
VKQAPGPREGAADMAEPEDVKVAQPRERKGGQAPSTSLWRRGHGKVDLASTRRAARHPEISPIWESVRRLEPAGEVSGVPALLKRDALQRRVLGVVDVVAAYVALLIAVYAVHGDHTSLSPWTLLLAPFVVLASKVIGLYDRDQHLLRKTTLDEMPQILYLAVVLALTTWLSETILLHGYLTRPQVFTLTLCSFGLMALGRLLVRAAVLAATSQERCIVLGSAVNASRIAEKLAAARSTNAVVVGRVAIDALEPDDAADRRAPAKLGDVRALVGIVGAHAVERVIIAPGHDGEEEMLDAIRVIKALGVKVSVLPRLLEVVGSSSSFDDVNGMWLLGVRHFGLSRSSETLKRVTDVIGASLLLVILLPLFAMLALAVKLTSRGGVFFSQQRIGRAGEVFKMLKFRSMVVGAETVKDTLRALNEAEGGLFKIDEDPRITRVGRLMRRTSLDELPQLLNVLRGEMSLVGPRPLVPDEDALIEGWQRRRLAVKPGMTGLWQIFGSARIPMHEMVKIDYLYGANWSIWLDMKILLRTIPYILGRHGQ